MKTTFVSLLAVIAFSVAAYSQNATTPPGPTWPEIKAQQKEEREALKSKQDSEFKLLIEMQKNTLQSSSAGAANSNDLMRLLAEERMAALKNYAQERTRLQEIQAEERKAFFPKQ